MKKKIIHGKISLGLSTLALCCWVASPVSAQSVPRQTSRPVQDNDTTRQELASFDQFLDSHRETAEQLRKEPSLIRSDEFVKSHPALQTYLQQHPEVREEINENPSAFMRKESRYDRFEDNRIATQPVESWAALTSSWMAIVKSPSSFVRILHS